MFEVSEWSQGGDLNGDGDDADAVLHVINLQTGSTTNLSVSTCDYGEDVEFAVAGSTIAYSSCPERLLYTYNLITHESRSFDLRGPHVYLSGEWIAYFETPWSEDGSKMEPRRPFVQNVRTGVATQLEQTIAIECGQGGGNRCFADFAVVDDWFVFRDGCSPETLNIYYAPSGSSRSIDIGRGPLVVVEHQVLLPIWEGAKGVDLNGDGDAIDFVCHAVDFSTGTLTNLGVEYCTPPKRWTLRAVSEQIAGDLNGDGDRDDVVPEAADAETGMMINLGLAVSEITWGSDRQWGPFLMERENWAAFVVSEADQNNTDLNGDGDALDLVVHVVEWASQGGFHRGDPNSSGDTDISDAITIFGFLFLGDPPTLSCRESADANNDGAIDISDGIYLLEWQFLGGAEPPAPGPTKMPCGFDPDPPGSPGDLGCESYSCK